MYYSRLNSPLVRYHTYHHLLHLFNFGRKWHQLEGERLTPLLELISPKQIVFLIHNHNPNRKSTLTVRGPCSYDYSRGYSFCSMQQVPLKSNLSRCVSRVPYACTACGHRMAHRKWKETKLQPGRAGQKSLNVLRTPPGKILPSEDSSVAGAVLL